eukprot:scaffold2195_cov127-Isochrysis_galbana.AAC.4
MYAMAAADVSDARRPESEKASASSHDRSHGSRTVNRGPSTKGEKVPVAVSPWTKKNKEGAGEGVRGQIMKMGRGAPVAVSPWTAATGGGGGVRKGREGHPVWCECCEHL